MKIVGLDTETTGLVHPDHRFVEVYLGNWDETGALIEELEQRINPQRSILPDAQNVHGISAGMVAHEPTWDMVAPRVVAFLDDADLIVAHNGVGFDFLFLNQELRRVGLPRIPSTIPVCDTMLEGRWAMPLGEAPSLQNLCFACDVPYDPALAHAASYDVHRMMDCFFKAVKWGFIKLPSPALPAVEEELSDAA